MDPCRRRAPPRRIFVTIGAKENPPRMSFEHGTLIQWNDDRGFGFIKPDLENSQVFVHIKSFGPIARRPAIGDRIWFDSMIGEQGKRKATVARITEGSSQPEGTSIRTEPSVRRTPPSVRRSEPRSSTGPSGWSSRPSRSTGIRGFRNRMKPFLLAVALLVGGISWISSKCSSSNPSSPAPLAMDRDHGSPVPQGVTSPAAPDAAFQCAGKHHCSQMTSKKEAQFYLASCPDVQVDGDGDGDACEEQFDR